MSDPLIAHDLDDEEAEELERDLGFEAQEPPRLQLTRGRVVGALVFVASAIAFLYVILPKLGGLNQTWSRLEQGDGKWLILAAGFEVGSYAGYVFLLRVVMPSNKGRFDWTTSYLITMAGVAATRLFATAGAGGIALTIWAIRKTGLRRREVAMRITAFMVLLYSVFMVSVLIGGIGLATGVFNGPAPIGITVVPAVLAASVIIIFLLFALVPADTERRLRGWSQGKGEVAAAAGRLVALPAAVSAGTREAMKLVRERHPGLLGAVAWWYFDIAVLWACLRAFGSQPAIVVVIVAYFVGQLGNLLPLPGGIGGVESAMVGALAAFGVDAGLALVAVLSYRAFSFWLPTVPGAIAFVQLRRRTQRWDEEDEALRSAPADAGTLEK
jgi:uncharacterized protein (TIRG00374 family)